MTCVAPVHGHGREVIVLFRHRFACLEFSAVRLSFGDCPMNRRRRAALAGARRDRARLCACDGPPPGSRVVKHRFRQGIDLCPRTVNPPDPEIRRRARILPQSMYTTAMSEHVLEDRSPASVPLSDVRNRLSEIVEEAATTGSDFVITRHGRPSAVIVGHDEYESMIETLNILSDPDTMAAIEEAEADIAAGALVELD